MDFMVHLCTPFGLCKDLFWTSFGLGSISFVDNVGMLFINYDFGI